MSRQVDDRRHVALSKVSGHQLLGRLLQLRNRVTTQNIIGGIFID